MKIISLIAKKVKKNAFRFIFYFLFILPITWVIVCIYFINIKKDDFVIIVNTPFFARKLLDTNLTDLEAVELSKYFMFEQYNIKESNRYAKKALSINSKNEDALFMVGRTEFVMGNPKNALFYLNKGISLYPKNQFFYYMRGLTYGFMGVEYLQLAANDFEMNILLDKANFNHKFSGSWASFNDLAWVYFQMGKFELAIENSNKSLEIYQDNAWALNILGTSQMNIGDNENAKINLEKALTQANLLTSEIWGEAYSGDNPKNYEDGLVSMTDTIIENLTLLKNK